MADQFLDYGGGNSLEDVLLKKLQAGTATPPTGGEVPTVPGAVQPTLDTGLQGAGVPKPGLGETVMQGLKDYGPLISQLGTALMRPVGPGAKGQETVGSAMGGAVTGALTSMKMNEALKKMIADQLSGGGKTFNEGQPVGLSNADVAGLTPDQVSGLYGVGLKARESELARPLAAMKTISEAYLHVMSADAKPAEMQMHLANAEKAFQEIAAAPVKNMIELMAKIQGMEKAQAEIGEIKAKTITETGKPAVQAAETAKTAAETKKLGLEADPAFIAFKKKLETQYGPLHEVRLGDRAILTNPSTGAQVGSYAIGAAPEAGAKVRKGEMDLTKAAMVRIAPLAVKALEVEMAAMPGGKQKVDLANLISSLRGYTGEIDPGVLLARASPDLKEKFNNLIDIYSGTSGISETRFGRIVETVFGVPAATPAPAAKPGEKSTVIGKHVPAPAAPTTTPEDYAKQLKGKPDGVYQNPDKTVSVTWQGGKVTNIEQSKSVPTNMPQYNFGTF